VSRNFQQIQHKVASYLRDPTGRPSPGNIEARRLKVYEDLFYNNMEGFLRGGFPVLHGILDAAGTWHPLVRQFFSSHPCETPYFTEISGEFVGWLQAGSASAGYPPYAAELAHYEWMELVLALEDASSTTAELSTTGDIMTQCPVLNPVSRVLRYQWPVTTLGPENPDVDPLQEPLHLLMYRDAENSVRFMSINLPTAELLSQLSLSASHPETGRAHLKRLAEKMPGIAPEQVLAFGQSLLEDFIRRGVLIGLLPAPAEYSPSLH